MRVALLHNLVAADAIASDQDTLVQVAAIRAALERLGHETSAFGCSLDLEAVRCWLLQTQPDMVFNLVESLGGSDGLALLATALLDNLGVAYTGNRTEATFLSNHKVLAKQQLCQAGLPTPGWLALDSQPLFGDDGYFGDPAFRPQMPYIIKTASEHASIGMDELAVVSCATVEELKDVIRQRSVLIGKPCFAEQYVEGREFNVAMLAGPEGPEVLPPSEILFSAFPPEKVRIVDYRAKWVEGSFEFENTPRHFDFGPQDQPLLDRQARLAQSCWKLFRLAGYARVDFRVDSAGHPWILEINTNPCIAPESGFAATIEQAGLGYDNLIHRIVEDAAARAAAADAFAVAVWE